MNLRLLFTTVRILQKITSNKMTFNSYYAHIIDYWKIKNYVENKLDDYKESKE